MDEKTGGENITEGSVTDVSNGTQRIDQREYIHRILKDAVPTLPPGRVAGAAPR